jgi:hypothetical protein
MQEEPAAGDERPSARADALTGAIWLAIAAAIVAGSWQMDRLERQGVQWFAAPGLVPGILGVLIAGAALLIVGRSVLRLAHGDTAGSLPPQVAGRTALTLVLCLGFAVGLVGHGVPFGVAAALYLFAHIFLLQLPERRAKGELARGALVALGIAIGVAAAVTFVFQSLFLVRLP